MSLLNQPSPIETFFQCGKAFIDSPSPVTGIELDDAAIALKRHALVQLQNESLANTLAQLSRPIRDQDIVAVKQLFESVNSMLRP